MLETAPTLKPPEAEPLPIIGLEPVVEPLPIVELQPNVPPTPAELKAQLQLHVADITQGIDNNARDYADERINERTTGGGLIARTFKKIWAGNIARDPIYLRELLRGRAREVESGNMFILQGGTQADHDRAAAAVIERYTNDTVHDGETQTLLAEMDGGADLEGQLKLVIKSFAIGELDVDALETEKNRLLAVFGQTSQASDRHKGQMFADNIVTVARHARSAVDSGVGMDRIDEALNGSMHTEARMGVRTEAKLNTVERIADRIHQTEIGSVLNENLIIAAAAIPLALCNFTTRKLAYAVGAFAGLGVGATVVAGFRESLHLKGDRRTVSRSEAEGGDGNLQYSGKRFESVENTVYERVAAAELIANLGQATAGASISVEGLRDAVATVTHVKARIAMSDENNVDLIGYSDKFEVETERLNLNISLAEARAAVQTVLTEADDATLTAAGVTGRDATALFDRQATLVEAALANLQEDMDAHDKSFKILQAKRVAGIGIIAGLGGAVFGLAFQEAKAAFSSELQGVLEAPTSGASRKTLLAAIFDRDNAPTPTPTLPGHNLVTVDTHATVNVPKGYHLTAVAGKWELFDSKNQAIDNNVTFDKAGQLSPGTKTLLAEKGFHFTDQPSVIHDKPTLVPGHVIRTPDDYMKTHPNNFTSIHRETWYDNNTKAFDENEQKLDWAGQGGVNANGDFVMSVKDMLPGGSSHNGLSANAQKMLHEGKLALALSMTKGSQGSVSLIKFDINGLATIHKGSFDAQSVYELRNGQAHFTGGYAEAVQLGDVHNGVQSVNVLATVVGDNHPHSGIDTTPRLVSQQHVMVTTTLTGPPVKAFNGLPIEVPPVLPIYGRGGLERSQRPEPLVVPPQEKSKELVPIKRWSKELVIPSRMSKELVIPTRRSKELVIPSGKNKELDAFRQWIAEDPTRSHNRVTAENKEGLETLLQYLAFDAPRSMTASQAEADQLSRRVLFALGFNKADYELTEDGLIIKSWDHIRNSLIRNLTRYGA